MNLHDQMVIGTAERSREATPRAGQAGKDNDQVRLQRKPSWCMRSVEKTVQLLLEIRTQMMSLERHGTNLRCARARVARLYAKEVGNSSRGVGLMGATPLK